MPSLRLLALQKILGAVVALSSLFPLPALLLALARGEPVQAFAASFALTAGLGLLLWWPVRRVRHDLRLRDGFLVTAAAWLIACLAASLPFVLGLPQLSLSQAGFEAVSGLTTTGATVLVGIDELPRSMLLYRQSLNFYGGLGLVLLAVAILPMLRIGGMQLFRAEATGPTKDGKLTPRIAETAKALWAIYLILNLLCALAYWAAGMDGFDAICHALSTVSTAGFSTHDASFGYWDNPMIELVAVLFMLVGATNFGLHYVAWRRATMAPYQQDTELRFFALIALSASLVAGLALWAAGPYESGTQAFRHAGFQAISNLTSTGFTSGDFSLWPGFTPLLLIMLAFIGGSSGSTSGGMKVARVVMAVRQGVREIRQLLHPKGEFIVKMSGRQVSERVVLSVASFCTLYVLSFIVVMLALSAVGLDLVTAFGAAAASINNLGPGLGAVAGDFSELPGAAIWICSFAMLLGRLEVFTILVLLAPAFWNE